MPLKNTCILTWDAIEKETPPNPHEFKMVAHGLMQTPVTPFCTLQFPLGKSGCCLENTVKIQSEMEVDLENRNEEDERDLGGRMEKKGRMMIEGGSQSRAWVCFLDKEKQQHERRERKRRKRTSTDEFVMFILCINLVLNVLWRNFVQEKPIRKRDALNK